MGDRPGISPPHPTSSAGLAFSSVCSHLKYLLMQSAGFDSLMTCVSKYMCIHCITYYYMPHLEHISQQIHIRILPVSAVAHRSRTLLPASPSSSLHFAARRIRWLIARRDDPQLHRQSSRQLIQHRRGQNETRRRNIDGGYVDPLALVVYLVARPTLRTVPALNRRRRTHIGKIFERTEGWIAFGREPVYAVGTRCIQGAQRRIAVHAVVADFYRFASCDGRTAVHAVVVDLPRIASCDGQSRGQDEEGKGCRMHFFFFVVELKASVVEAAEWISREGIGEERENK